MKIKRHYFDSSLCFEAVCFYWVMWNHLVNSFKFRILHFECFEPQRLQNRPFPEVWRWFFLVLSRRSLKIEDGVFVWRLFMFSFYLPLVKDTLRYSTISTKICAITCLCFTITSRGHHLYKELITNYHVFFQPWAKATFSLFPHSSFFFFLTLHALEW